MPVIDFSTWVTPNLDITLGDVTYSCPPPSVAKARLLLAFAALAEHNLGLAEGEPDPELVALADAQEDTLAVVTLGRDVYDRMVADGVTQTTIDRVGYYGVHYWARGKLQADYIAQALWAQTAKEAGDAAPKAPRPSQSGPSTA